MFWSIAENTIRIWNYCPSFINMMHRKFDDCKKNQFGVAQATPYSLPLFKEQSHSSCQVLAEFAGGVRIDCHSLRIGKRNLRRT